MTSRLPRGAIFWSGLFFLVFAASRAQAKPIQPRPLKAPVPVSDGRDCQKLAELVVQLDKTPSMSKDMANLRASAVLQRITKGSVKNGVHDICNGAETTDPQTCLVKVAQECVRRPLADLGPKKEASGAGALVSSAAGASWQSEALNGLASFLTDRAKQELVLWLVSTFQNQLCAAGKQWFPATCQILAQSDSAQQGVPGNLLSSAVRKDLEHLPMSAAMNTGGNTSLLAVGAVLGLLAVTVEIVKTAGTDKSKILPTLKQKLLDAGKGCTGDGKESGCELITAGILLFQLAEEGQASCEKAQPAIDGLIADWKKVTRHDMPKHLQELIQCSTWNQKRKDSFAALVHSAMALRQQATAASPNTTAILGDVTGLLGGLSGFLWEGTDDGKQKDARYWKATALAFAGTEALFQVLTQVREGKPPLELLAGLEALAEDGPLLYLCQDDSVHESKAANVGCTVAAVGLVAARLGDAVRLAEMDQPWNESSVCNSIKDLLNLGLFSQDPNAPAGLDKLKVPDQAGIRKLSKLMMNENACTAVLQTTLGNPDYQQMRGIYRAVFDLTKAARAWQQSGGPSAVQKAGMVLGWTEQIVESSAQLLGDLEEPKLKAVLAGVKAVSLMLQSQYTDGLREVLAGLGDLADQLPAPVRRYVVLIGDLAEAKTAAEVQTALEGAAAPVGSWRIKRERFIASVTGVVGAHLGAEFVPSRSPPDLGFSAGAFASLGLDLAWPVGHQSTFGLYLTALDVGQLAYARVVSSDAQAKTQSNVSFLSVFSPGLYLRLGVWKTPFTLGGGCSYSPQLRQYFVRTNMNGDEVDQPFSAIRCGAFLGVDITILPFSSKK